MWTSGTPLIFGSGRPPQHGAVTVSEFLTRTWMPNKRRHVRATTGCRYAWFVDRSVNPAIGAIPLRRLRSDHLDDLYEQLATTGGRQGTGLAPKTIAEVHMIVRAALNDAVARELVAGNVACHVRSRRRPAAHATARSWTAQELHQFLTAAAAQRRYPALHLAAHTGMRRPPHGSDEGMFCNTSGRFLNPESLTQLVDRIVQRSELQRTFSTTCATPTPHSSSPTVLPSKSCPNDSGTPTRPSRCTPTSIFSQA